MGTSKTTQPVETMDAVAPAAADNKAPAKRKSKAKKKTKKKAKKSAKKASKKATVQSTATEGGDEGQQTDDAGAVAGKKVSKKTTKKKARKKVAKKSSSKKASGKKKTDAAPAARVKPYVPPAPYVPADPANIDSSRKGFRALVVVESPTKAKTVKKYLGKGYVVKASVGHVKDLPKSRMAVDIEHGFVPQYETIRGKSKVLKEIKDAARDVDVIYLAPDPDREGEAIAWHIYEELGKRHAHHTHRIAFHEITKKAVHEAIAKPTALNQKRFESQQARRILDRIVGYQISPILWDKVRRGLSAGRVQSVAVRLVVARESEVLAFVPQEYWSVEALLRCGEHSFVAAVVRENGEKFRPETQAAAAEAVRVIQNSALQVQNVQRKERRRKAAPPLITSKLQQEAASRLRFTAKRTMMVAQQLYEGVELGAEGAVGLITYMRTDSTRLSADAVTEAREYIRASYGPDYLPAEAVEYRSKKSAQDAHEAIRPTSMSYPPDAVRPFLTAEQLKLYTLIWRSFLACQMQPAVFDQTSAEFAAGAYLLRASGSQLRFAGFLAVYADDEQPSSEQAPATGEDVDAVKSKGQLPPLEEGAAVQTTQVVPEQHFTQAPPRFTESSLVRELEEKGIGRPSTYATILSTIVTRGYVSKEEGRFGPTELGLLITELLLASFPQVMDVAFTAEMEEQLDQVETGDVDWVKLLQKFYFDGFEQSLALSKTQMRDVKREEIPTAHDCDKCGKNMLQKWGRNGSFLACSGYPACRNTRDYKRLSDGTLELVPEEKTDLRCPACKGPMVVKRGRYGAFLACETYPECKGSRPVSIGVDCPNKCGNYLAERRSKMGRVFYGCAGYPSCTFAAWDRPVPGVCPVCQAPYLLRKYSKRDGVTIKCSDKTCSYTRDPELDDADAQAVAN